jgi:hypothetical protein
LKQFVDACAFLWNIVLDNEKSNKKGQGSGLPRITVCADSTVTWEPNESTAEKKFQR